MGYLLKEFVPPTPSVPAIPPVAPTPAYTSTTIEKRTTCYDGSMYTIYDSWGNAVGYGYLPGFCVTSDVPVRTEHPATPGSPGTPGSPAVPADYHEGWTAAARSVDDAIGPVRFFFQTAITNYGVVAGLTDVDASPGYAKIKYALYCAGGTARVMESGAELGASFPVSNDDVLSVVRIGTQVRYFQNDTLVYTSLVACSATLMFADASLYRGNDVIVAAGFDPALGGAFAAASGELVGVLGNIEGYLSAGGESALVGRLSPLVGAFLASADSLVGILGQLRPSLGGGGLSAIMEGELGQLQADFTQAMLLPTVGDLFATLQPLSGFFLGLVGNAGGFAGTLGNVDGYLTNVGYAVMQGQLGGIQSQWGTPQWIQPTVMRTQFSMECGIEVSRAAHAAFQIVASMQAELEITRQLSASFAAEAILQAELAVSRTFAAAFAVQASMAAAAAVSRTLRGEMVDTASMAAGIVVTRTFGVEFASVAGMAVHLHVQREIVPELEEITISPNPREGVVVHPTVDTAEVSNAPVS